MMTGSRFKIVCALLLAVASACRAGASISEIKVDLKLDASSYVVGERVRGVVEIVNGSPDIIQVDYAGSEDHFVIEVFRKSDGLQLDRVVRRRFTAPFRLSHNEGQKLEVRLADHYGLTANGAYNVRAVLVHRDTRYEGPIRSFDIVPGMKLAGALQLFKEPEGQRREFEIAKWSRNGKEHVFLKSRDVAPVERTWPTFDLGPYMKINPPVISILTNGEVLTVHRLDPQNFMRTDFWSLPDRLVARGGIPIRDPETAGQDRVQEVFNNGKPVEATDSSWWKFWK